MTTRVKHAVFAFREPKPSVLARHIYDRCKTSINGKTVDGFRVDIGPLLNKVSDKYWKRTPASMLADVEGKSFHIYLHGGIRYRTQFVVVDLITRPQFDVQVEVPPGTPHAVIACLSSTFNELSGDVR